MKMGKSLKIRHLNIATIAIGLGISLIPIMGSGEAGAITLKFTHQFPEKDGYSRAATYWCDLVEKRTEGRVKFQHFYASSLVKSPQVLDSLKTGIADAGYGAISFSTGKVPDFAALELQGVVPKDKWVDVYKEIGPVLSRIFAKQNVKYFWGPYMGRQSFVCKKRFLKTPDDYKNLKMRAAGLWITKTLKMWGSSPVFLDIGELYTALQRGTVDGAISAPFLDKSLKLYEVAPYLNYYDYLVGNFVYVGMNMNVWKKISEKDQKIMIESVNDAYLYSDKETRKIEANIIAEMKAMKNVNVNEMTNEETADLIRLTAPLWDEAREGSGPLGKQLADILSKYKVK